MLVEIGNNHGFCDDHCPVDHYFVYDGTTKRCKPQTHLNNYIAYGPELGSIELNFGVDIASFKDELLDSIEIAIKFRKDQPKIQYKYTLTPSTNGQSLMLNLTFYGHLLPRSILYVIYNLPERGNTDVASTLNIAAPTQVLRLIEVYGNAQGNSRYVDSASTFSTISLSANQIFSWTTSIMLRSVHSLRTKAVEDMIGYLVFMNVDYANNFVEFAKDSLDSFELLMPNMFQYIIEAIQEGKEDARRLSQLKNRSRRLIDDTNNMALSRIMTTQAFLLNHGAATTLLLLCAVFVGLLEILRRFLKKTKRFAKFKKILEMASVGLCWNFLLGNFLGEYQGFIFFSMVEVFADFEDPEDRTSLSHSFALIFFLISIVTLPGMFLLTYIVIKRKRAEEENLKDMVKEDDSSISFLDRTAILHSSFKQEKYIYFLYPHFICLRSFGYTLLLLVGANTPLLQILFIIFSNGGIIAYLLYYKPLSSKVQQWLTVIYEGFFMSVCIAILILQIYNQANPDDYEEDIRTRLCLTILTLSMLMFAFNLVSFCFELVDLRNKYFKKKKK